MAIAPPSCFPGRYLPHRPDDSHLPRGADRKTEVHREIAEDFFGSCRTIHGNVRTWKEIRNIERFVASWGLVSVCSSTRGLRGASCQHRVRYDYGRTGGGPGFSHVQSEGRATAVQYRFFSHDTRKGQRSEIGFFDVPSAYLRTDTTYCKLIVKIGAIDCPIYEPKEGYKNIIIGSISIQFKVT
jgi:hypothetical protein